MCDSPSSLFPAQLEHLVLQAELRHVSSERREAGSCGWTLSKGPREEWSHRRSFCPAHIKPPKAFEWHERVRFTLNSNFHIFFKWWFQIFWICVVFFFGALSHNWQTSNSKNAWSILVNVWWNCNKLYCSVLDILEKHKWMLKGRNHP